MKKPVLARLFSVTALTLAAPALAQQSGSVSDYQLPTEQATSRPRAQGPVTEGIPPPRVVRPTPTPTATPRVPRALETVDPGQAETPAPDPLAAIDAMGANRERAPRTAASPGTPSADATSAAAETPAASPEEADGEAAAPAFTTPLASAPAGAARQPAEPAAAEAPASGFGWWPWLLALLAVGVVGAVAGWFWRGRRSEPVWLAPPQIERPRVAPRPAEPAPQAPQPGVAERPAPPAELPRVAAAPPPPPAAAPPRRPPVRPNRTTTRSRRCGSRSSPRGSASACSRRRSPTASC